MSLFDFVDDCARFGLQGAELTSYYFPEPVVDDYLRKLKFHCFRQGVDISGTAIRCDFGLPPGQVRDTEIAAVKRWADRAVVLGAPVIRIFAGKQPEGQSSERTHELIVEGIQECCEYAGSLGIHLALENHGGPTATADGLIEIIAAIESDWFGVNLDTGNFHSVDVYGDLARIAPYAINVQVKVDVSGPDEVTRPTDFSKLASVLQDAGYRGYIVLEYEESLDPRSESERYLNLLRDAFVSG